MLTRRTFLRAIGASPLIVSPWTDGQKIRVGVCTRDIAGAAKYRFDYVEPSASEIDSFSEEQLRNFAAGASAAQLRCEVFNSFIRRPELKVVGNDVSLLALREYVEHCLARCRSLGASIVVWGSAGSRNVPDGFSLQRAQRQIAEFLAMAGDVAWRYEVVIAIEPLRRQESNILNTGAEALKMVRTVNHSNVRMIIDYFHLREENEDPHILQDARDQVVHLHFANSHGRLWPHNLAEDDHYREFFAYLKKTGYSGRISIEGHGSFESDGAASRAFFRDALA